MKTARKMWGDLRDYRQVGGKHVLSGLPLDRIVSSPKYLESLFSTRELRPYSASKLLAVIYR